MKNILKLAAVCTLLSLPGSVTVAAPARTAKSSAKPVWFHEHKAALAQARKTHKPILIDVNTSWCGPCQMMKHEVFEKSAFAKEASRWVLLDLDGDAHAELAGFYKVEGFPTLIALNSHGKVIGKQVGYGGPAMTLKFFKDTYSKAKKP